MSSKTEKTETGERQRASPDKREGERGGGRSKKTEDWERYEYIRTDKAIQTAWEREE